MQAGAREDFYPRSHYACTTLRETTNRRCYQRAPHHSHPGSGAEDYTIRRVVQSVPGLGAYVA